MQRKRVRGSHGSFGNTRVNTHTPSAAAVRPRRKQKERENPPSPTKRGCSAQGSTHAYIAQRAGRNLVLSLSVVALEPIAHVPRALPVRGDLKTSLLDLRSTRVSTQPPLPLPCTAGSLFSLQACMHVLMYISSPLQETCRRTHS